MNQKQLFTLLVLLFFSLTGISNQCVRFNNNYALFPTSSLLRPSDQITVECWIKPEIYYNWGAPVCYSVDNKYNESGFALAFNDEDPHRRFFKRELTSLEWLASRAHPVKEARHNIRNRTIESRGRVVKSLASVAEKITEKFDAELILCPHHHEDFRMIADFFEICSSRLKHQVATVNGVR